MVSDKQLQANKANASLGGVKSKAGKSISKYNAVKHGILRQTLTEYEDDIFQDIADELLEHYKPQGFVEKMLVERIAVHYVKLFRIQKAETEYMKSRLDPREVHIEGGIQLIPMGEPERVVVDNEGYVPKLDGSVIEYISSSFSRYETSIENKLYRAMHELERIQRQRGGDNVSAPIALEVGMGSFSKTGENDD